MIEFNKINDNSIIICPSSKKIDLLRLKSKFAVEMNIKFMNKEEILSNVNFSYDYNAVLFLSKKYHYSYELSDEIISNLNVRATFNDKLKKLNDIYIDLYNNGYLIFNDYYINLFKNKTIYVYGYSKKDQELLLALSKVNVMPIYLEDEKNDLNNLILYKYQTLEEEVNALFYNIITLIKNGISMNNIFIYKYPEEYQLIIKKYAKMHHLIIEDGQNKKLYQSPIFKKFIKYLENDDIVSSFNKIKDELVVDQDDILDGLIKIITAVDYDKLSKEDLIDIVCFAAKKINVKTPTYEESIKVIDYNKNVSSDDHIFILGFYLGAYPNIYSDTSFYLDYEKKILGLNDSKTNSMIDEELLTNFIVNNSKQLVLSYKEKMNKTIYYPSLLVNKLKIKIVNGKQYNKVFSHQIYKLRLAKALDLYENYGIDSSVLDLNKKEEIGYRSYDNSFKGIDKYDNNEIIKLSYTSINEYNNCAFAYFVKRILKADIFEERFETNLGTLYHQILEDSYDHDILLDDYNDYILEHFPTAKEEFFARMLLPQVLDVIKVNKEMVKKTKYNHILTEENENIKLDDNSYLTGKIDKLMIDEENKSLVIVDYKTGSFSFVPEKVKYGLNLQLPIYAYLANYKYAGYDVDGLYIQNVCVNPSSVTDENYTLKGVTVDEYSKLERLDPSVKMDKVKKATFVDVSVTSNKEVYKSKNVFSRDEINKLSDVASENMANIIQKIRLGSFDINPIEIIKDGKPINTIQCKYCPCANICFKEDKDIRRVYIDDRKGENDEI